MQRIFGLVFSGFAVKLYAAAMALWIVSEAAGFVVQAFGTVTKGLGQ